MRLVGTLLGGCEGHFLETERHFLRHADAPAHRLVVYRIRVDARDKRDTIYHRLFTIYISLFITYKSLRLKVSLMSLVIENRRMAHHNQSVVGRLVSDQSVPRVSL